MTGSRRTTPLPVTRQQAEAEVEVTSAATTAPTSIDNNDDGREKSDLELGAATTVFAMAVLLGWLCLPSEAKHPGNARLTASLLLSFATFLTGNALTLLSFTMLGLVRDRGRRDHLVVSGGQRAAARCLRAACPVMLTLTLLSLLAVPRGGAYLYLGLAFLTITVPAAAAVHCYLARRRRRSADGGGDGEVDEEEEEEQKKELEAAWKITSSVTTTAFGGIVGVLFSASKLSSSSSGGGAAVNAAIFLMFATAILGMFVTTVSKTVPAEIAGARCGRKMFVTCVRLANALLLCTLAYAALAAAFAVSRYRVFMAFAPLAVTAAVSLLLRHCVVGGRREEEDDGGEEQRIKAMEEIAGKVMVAAVGGIMSVLGGWLGEKDHGKWGATTMMDVFMVLLTSAFVSGFGFVVLAAAPGSARERLARPVATVLVWSSAALFAATAVAVYGVEVSSGLG